jgi:predicted TIM-barrel fold metal-dependent hydrolase
MRAMDGWAGDGAVQEQIDATVKDGIRRAQSKLAAGPFRGVGERVVNGDGIDHLPDERGLMGVYRVAGEHHVPVNLHYTIGSDSLNERGTPRHVEALENALHGNPAVSFLLAHCGAGPAPHRSDYEDTLRRLLSVHANLYVDIAGMSIDLYASGGELTDLGRIILDVMEDFPERFLVGFDMGDDLHPYASGSTAVSPYTAFLSSLPEASRRRVAIENAYDLLFEE